MAPAFLWKGQKMEIHVNVILDIDDEKVTDKSVASAAARIAVQNTLEKHLASDGVEVTFVSTESVQ